MYHPVACKSLSQLLTCQVGH